MKKKYILMFDVHRDHERIIQDLISKNWHSVIQGFQTETRKPIVCYLPETTWWKEFSSKREAYDEFKLIAGVDNIIRQVVSVFDEWICSTGNPMKHQIEEVRNLKLVNG